LDGAFCCPRDEAVCSTSGNHDLVTWDRLVLRRPLVVQPVSVAVFASASPNPFRTYRSTRANCSVLLANYLGRAEQRGKVVPSVCRPIRVCRHVIDQLVITGRIAP